MQILKKRNTTEPFNHNKSDGITNYDSWLDNYQEEGAIGLMKHTPLIDTNTNPITNPYNGVFQWNTAKPGTNIDGSLVYHIYYLWVIKAPYSGRIDYNMSMESFTPYYETLGYGHNYSCRVYGSRQQKGDWGIYNIVDGNLSLGGSEKHVSKEGSFYITRTDSVVFQLQLNYVPREYGQDPFGNNLQTLFTGINGDVNQKIRLSIYEYGRF